MENVACSLTAGETRARRERWRVLAKRALVERAPTDTGARLRFRGADGVEPELRELARLEAECCGFARFDVHATGGEVVLDVVAAGAEGAAAARELFAAA